MTDPYRATRTQAEMYTYQMLYPASDAYNLSFCFVIRERVELSVLEGIARGFESRHHVFRNRFFMKDGAVWQYRHADPIRLETAMDSALDDAKFKRDILPELEAWSARSFDLEHDPLLRYRLYSNGDSFHCMYFCIHHSIADVYSMYAFTSYIAEGLSGVGEDRSSVTQYRDCVAGKSDGPRAISDSYRNSLLRFLEIGNEHSVDDCLDALTHEYLVDGPLASACADFFRLRNYSPFVFFISCFLCARMFMSDRRQIAVGVPVAGRKGKEVRSAFGLFVNVLPLLGAIDDETSFKDLMDDVGRQLFVLLRNQDVSLHDAMNLAGKPGVSSFDQTFTFYKEEINLLVEAKKVETLKFRRRNAQFPLSLAVQETTEGYLFEYVHSRGHFDEESVRTLHGILANVATQAVASPDIRVRDIAFCPPGLKDTILNGFNATAAPYPEDTTVTALFEDIVARFPDNIAVVSGETSLSYRELDRRANMLAARLADVGVGSGAKVGLLLDRDADLAIAIMGIIKSGAAYVPADPEHPDERIRFMFNDAGVKAVVAKSDHGRHFLAENGRVLLGLREDASYDARGEHVPSVGGAGDLLYVIYTSGTTGKPKGVMATHRNVVNCIASNTREFGVKPDERILLFASAVFDASVEQMFLALLNGAALVVASREDIGDTLRFRDLLARQGVTHVHATPSFLSGTDLSGLPSLRRIIAGGEKCGHELYARNRRNAAFYNEYGPTETTITSTMVSDWAGERPGRIGIGRPIANTFVYFFNGLGFAPPGVAGELCIGGAGVTDGYLGRPDLTAEKFVPNPFRPGETMYRSGDLGRWLPDGTIEFLGRIDDQVKIRGYRIELGEIETALVSCRGIRSCVVTVRENASGGNGLTAYLVSDAEIDVATLRDELRVTLPDYMLPSYFVRIDAIPLTVNGKVDKRALPEPGERMLKESAFIAPATEAERLVASVWSAVLGVPEIGLDDSFFHVGGDSIKAIQVSGRLKTEGYEVSTRDIFESLTVRSLAARLNAVSRVVDQEPVSGDLVPTPIQRMFMETWNGNMNHYNQSAVLKAIPGSLDGEAVRMTVKRLREHHDILRSRWERLPDGSWKGRQEGLGFDFPECVEVLPGIAVGENEMTAAMDGAQRSLSLSEGRIIKVIVGRGPDCDRIGFVIHHLAVDGVSWRILLEDFIAGYGMARSSKDIMLPVKTTSFLEWASRLDGFAAGGGLEGERTYWDSVSRKSIVRPGLTGNGSFGFLECGFELGTEMTRKLLVEANRAFNTEVNDLLLAALVRSLRSTFGNGCHAISLEGHGREDVLGDVDLSRTVGWFTTMYPVTFDASGDDDASVILNVKETLRQVPGKGIGYGILKYMRGGFGAESRESQPWVSFNYLGEFRLPGGTPGFSADMIPMGDMVDPSGTSGHAIDVTGILIGPSLVMKLRGRRDLVSDSVLERFTRTYAESLSLMVDHCAKCETTTRTASDFSSKDLLPEELEAIFS